MNLTQLSAPMFLIDATLFLTMTILRMTTQKMTMNFMRLSGRLLFAVLLVMAICGCSDGKPAGSDADGVSTDGAESAGPTPAGKQRSGNFVSR